MIYINTLLSLDRLLYMSTNKNLDFKLKNLFTLIN